MLDYERDRLQYILNKEKDIKEREEKVVDGTNCKNELDVCKKSIDNIKESIANSIANFNNGITQVQQNNKTEVSVPSTQVPDTPVIEVKSEVKSEAKSEVKTEQNNQTSATQSVGSNESQLNNESESTTDSSIYIKEDSNGTTLDAVMSYLTNTGNNGATCKN
jgi:hypothetical protein